MKTLHDSVRMNDLKWILTTLPSAIKEFYMKRTGQILITFQSREKDFRDIYSRYLLGQSH